VGRHCHGEHRGGAKHGGGESGKALGHDVLLGWV
jgi:hypothetical protein